MNKSDIAQLAAKAKNGDNAAFEKLYKEFYPKVYYFAKQNVGSLDAAEDITAETFCAAMESIGSLRSEESFVGWLYWIISRPPSLTENSVNRQHSLRRFQSR